MAIVNIENVVKTFGDHKAVNDVSFGVEGGRMFGLLGPNGAGKTTMIRMITNIMVPDTGNISIFGESVGPAHQSRIGYLPEERGLYKKVKVIDQLAYFAQLKGMNRKDAVSEARRWLASLDASDWENKKIQELSKGMQQKVQFISTILHKPDLLILDEPFSGFDPVNTELLKSVVLDLKASGVTIILSTHVMEQVEKLCDDICLINRGRKVLSGPVRDIKKSFGRDTARIEFDGDDSFLDQLSVKYISRTKNRAEFRVPGEGSELQGILKSALEKTNVVKFELVEPSLHEIFIDVVSRREDENEG
ncbi:MAG: ABC transporter ATP-binding protein [Bacteroidota bacterium]